MGELSSQFKSAALGKDGIILAQPKAYYFYIITFQMETPGRSCVDHIPMLINESHCAFLLLCFVLGPAGWVQNTGVQAGWLFAAPHKGCGREQALLCP